ncbi:hypothetical protein [Kineosporia sp. NBRC 101731]|uniref:hypothetical protein n=1 Tax=Kineosporia sp. NBRC 101731 TaxID=3032199 RepID=UPI0024A36B88|nr:hypothetical protein [Kineosporia sp. NBRC 101731]GLY33482.1 hypothetical protein Kisp02_68470 [Kineosporia sp. NBRC 101731]
MDIALIFLILCTAGYAAVMALLVAWRRGHRQPVRTGALTLVAVAASFFAAVGLARLDIFAMIAFIATATAVSTYGVLHHDLGRRRAVATAVVMMLVTTAASLFISYLAPMALVATASTYLLVRVWISTRQALMIMSAAFGGLIVLGGTFFYIGVSNM